MLSKGGAKAIDDSTVEFTLDAPTGNFPYLASSDNYNAIILPKDYEGDWERTFIGTGPWKLGEYRPGVGITLVPNEQYWDPARKPLAEKAEIVFFTNEQSLVLGFQGNQVDVVVQFSVSGGKALLTDPAVVTTELKSSAHRQCHMRCDVEPFNDKRIRQAVGLLVNRTNLVDGLLDTKTDIGNDSPFAPVFPSTSPDVRQREQNVAEAQEAARGGRRRRRVQRHAVHVAGLRDAGLRPAPPAGPAGRQHPPRPQHHRRRHLLRRRHVRQLALAGLDDRDHRVRPPWGAQRAARGAAAQRRAPGTAPTSRTRPTTSCSPTTRRPIDLDSQRTAAKQIQELLLDETPILFTYFYYFLSGAKDYVAGVETTAMGHTDVSRTGFI